MRFYETDNPSVQEGIRAYVKSVNPAQADAFVEVEQEDAN